MILFYNNNANIVISVTEMKEIVTNKMTKIALVKKIDGTEIMKLKRIGTDMNVMKDGLWNEKRTEKVQLHIHRNLG